jgi:hypothetical protein
MTTIINYKLRTPLNEAIVLYFNAKSQYLSVGIQEDYIIPQSE